MLFKKLKLIREKIRSSLTDTLSLACGFPCAPYGREPETGYPYGDKDGILIIKPDGNYAASRKTLEVYREKHQKRRNENVKRIISCHITWPLSD